MCAKLSVYNDINIDIWYFGNFESMENIRRKCNLMMDLSKFTFNKKILSWVQVCNQALPYNNRFIYLFILILIDVLIFQPMVFWWCPLLLIGQKRNDPLWWISWSKFIK